MLVAGIILISSSSVKSQNSSWKSYDTLATGYGSMFCELSYMYNSSSEYFDIEVGPGILLHKNKIEYRYPFFAFSGVKRNSNFYRISYQAPVNWLLMLCGHFIDKLLYPNSDGSYLIANRPVRYFVFLPNSSLSYEVGDGVHLGISTHTDYLFERKDGLDRGILFSPSLGISFTRDRQLTGRGGITISSTYSKFWNFEGESQSDRFGIKVTIYGDFTSH